MKIMTMTGSTKPKTNNKNNKNNTNNTSKNKNYYPTGSTVPFPYAKPYEQQVALMDALLEGVQTTSSSSNNNTTTTCKIMCLESPTGTGKSLSLACASLAWQEYMEQMENEEFNEQNQDPVLVQDEQSSNATFTASTTPPPTATTSTGISWLDEWQQPDADDEQKLKQKQKQEQQTAEHQRYLQLLQTLETIRFEWQNTSDPQEPTSAFHRRENLIRQAVTKAKVAARKRQRQRQNQHPKKPMVLNYEMDEDEDDDLERRQRTPTTRPTPGSAEWLLEPPMRYNKTSNTTSTKQFPPSQTNRNRRQIIYAARTHSQLSQFIGEVRKTKWGATTRIVAVASRSQGLCGYSLTNHGTHRNLGLVSEANLTEQCLELRQSKKRTSASSSTCACPYYQPSAIASLALQSLAAPTDLEDMVRWGQATQTCAYYATRKAIAQAQLIVVPYTILLDPKTRESTGLQLQDALVLVDEAHNLPQAIEGVTSARLGLVVCQAALRQVQAYTKKYLLEQDRLNARHAQLLGQLKTILNAFIKSLLVTTTITNNAHENNVQARGSQVNHHHNPPKKKKTLLPISQFLCDYRLDSINLFPLLRYLQESRLSQKLLGFMKDDDGTAQKEQSTSDNNIGANHGAATVSALTTKKTNSTLSSHISPMSIVESFLTKMNTYDPQHAKMVVNRMTSPSASSSDPSRQHPPQEEACLELVVLNPAVHAQDDLYKLPHAVCLVGGTLQPLPTLMQELVPSLTHEAIQAQDIIRRNNSSSNSNNIKSSIRYQSPSFVGFSCGHVVSPDHVLLQALTQVGSTTLDIRYATRSTPAMFQAIGQGILDVCRVVPHGVVVFLPSYSYEQALVQAWKTLKVTHKQQSTAPTSFTTTASTIWDAIQQVKPIFREPKQRMDMEATLQAFARAAESSSSSTSHNNNNGKSCGDGGGGDGGALLLAVVGGKLSEGINFANRLCRCVVVVGLPYADKSDPVLQEKLRYLDKNAAEAAAAVAAGKGNGQTKKSNHSNSNSNNNYYQALCLRAVNQSVGRAIRHANDFAAIVVMDARYPQSPEIANGLPQWLTSSTPTWRQQDGRLEAVTQRLYQFFQNPKFREG